MQIVSLAKVSESGVSIWLDDLSRERMVKGGKATFLHDLIEKDCVVGVTTNPAIFAAAIANSDLYRGDIESLFKSGKSSEEVITELTTTDVREACQLFLPIYESSGGVDGRVSIEVDPRLARDTEGTIRQARELWQLVDMPNVLIKVPATREGLPAIKTLTSEGISVNVTIIFSVTRYREVLESFIAGLEERRERGLPVGDIHSVASFFVSRVDTEIDSRLKGTAHEELRGKAALANARLAYEHFTEVASSDRWRTLEREGAAIQRPLWASTGVKDPTYEPTMYVLELIAEKTVNTMPEATLDAVRATALEVSGSILGKFDSARSILSSLKDIGIDIEEVATKLELEGIDKFIKPWLELIETVNRLK